MSKKKKITFATIAVILIVAIIVGIVLYNSANKITIDDLFIKNREYFKNLESITVTIDEHFESQYVQDGEDKKVLINWISTVQKHIPSDSTFIKSEYITEQHGHEYDVFRNLYKVQENGETLTYFNEKFYGKDEGWFSNKTNDQLEGVALVQDFALIEHFDAILTLEENTVDFNGISCYKATGKYYGIHEIADYYGIRQEIGPFGYEFLDLYTDVTVYFREDTGIIYCIEYDFTDTMLEVYRRVMYQDLKYGKLTLTVYFDEFNTLQEIIVPDSVKEVTTEYFGSASLDPIDINDEYYEISGDFNFKFGKTVKDYCENYTIILIGTEESVETLMVEVKESVFAYFYDKTGNSFMVEVKNTDDEPKPYLECYVKKIKIDVETYSEFSKLQLGSDITGNSSFKECKNKLGRYTSSYDNGDAMIYKWASYIDYCEIEIAFDNETGKMQYFQLNFWDVNFWLNEKLKQ